jgi:hypothetical protein
MDGVLLAMAQKGASVGWFNPQDETLVWIFAGWEKL